MSSDDAVSDAWLHAISETSACLQARGNYKEIGTTIDNALVTVADMEKLLLAFTEQWDRAPTVLPPSSEAPIADASSVPNSSYPQISISIPTPSAGTNRYASIQYGEDSSDEEEEPEDMDDGGDIPMLNHAPFPPKINGISMRRLMIRIITLHSEILAKKGCHCRTTSPPMWVTGADFYQASLQRIQDALALADSEISRLFQTNFRQFSELEEDADIVGLAVGRLTQECAKFQRDAEFQKERLLKKLNPQWVSRDIIKAAWGERWESNPNPRNKWTDIRRMDEQQLKDIEAALLKMAEMETEVAQEEAQRLKSRVRVPGKASKKNGKKKKPKVKRYNKLRPTDITCRVALDLYPDPTTFGWKFTGSDKFVEFFEKDGIKLDWYFTTATIKTSMHHNKHGSTQMFGSRVTPEIYTKILQNPRQHTDVRYRTKANKPPVI